jgi:hypothetical protein
MSSTDDTTNSLKNEPNYSKLQDSVNNLISDLISKINETITLCTRDNKFKDDGYILECVRSGEYINILRDSSTGILQQLRTYNINLFKNGSLDKYSEYEKKIKFSLMRTIDSTIRHAIFLFNSGRDQSRMWLERIGGDILFKLENIFKNPEQLLTDLDELYLHHIPLPNPPKVFYVQKSFTHNSLVWMNNSSRPVTFFIERQIDFLGKWIPVLESKSNISSYDDPNIINNKKYYYRIRSFDGANYSVWRNSYSDGKELCKPCKPQTFPAAVTYTLIVILVLLIISFIYVVYKKTNA